MGERLDGRSDIFSLGVVAFEMLSGQQPFPGPNVTSILYRLVHTDPVEPPGLELLGLAAGEVARGLPEGALAKKPESPLPDRERLRAGPRVLPRLVVHGPRQRGDHDVAGDGRRGRGRETRSGTPRRCRFHACRRPWRPRGARPRRRSRRSPSKRRSCSAPAEAGVEPQPTATTLVLERPPVAAPDPPPPPTLIAAAEVTAIAPADGSQTQPPSPTVRRPPSAPAVASAPPKPAPSGPSAAAGAGRRGGARGSRRARRLDVAAAGRGARERARVELQLSPRRLQLRPRSRRRPRPGPSRPGRRLSRPASLRRLRPSRGPPRPTGACRRDLDALRAPPSSVDGKPAGQTPLRGLKLQPGKRRLELALAGHETLRPRSTSSRARAGAST